MGDYFAEESHIWSSGRTHYKNSYYSDKFNQLKHIVEFVNSFKKNLKTSDKLDVLKDNPEFGQFGTPFDYSNYIDDIFRDS